MIRCDMCNELFVWRHNQDLINGLCYECIKVCPSDLRSVGQT